MADLRSELRQVATNYLLMDENLSGEATELPFAAELEQPVPVADSTAGSGERNAQTEGTAVVSGDRIAHETEGNSVDPWAGWTGCVCGGGFEGEMIGCDGGCNDWFHFECVGLKKQPRGEWICGACNEKAKRRKQEAALEQVFNRPAGENLWPRSPFFAFGIGRERDLRGGAGEGFAQAPQGAELCRLIIGRRCQRTHLSTSARTATAAGADGLCSAVGFQS